MSDLRPFDFHFAGQHSAAPSSPSFYYRLLVFAAEMQTPNDLLNNMATLHGPSPPDAEAFGNFILSDCLTLTTRSEHEDIWQRGSIKLAGLYDVKFAFDEIELSHDSALDDSGARVARIEPHYKYALVFQGLHILIQDGFDLAVRHVIEGFPEQDYVELLRRVVTEKIRDYKTVFFRASIFFGPANSLLKGCLGDVHPNITSISSLRQFIGSVTRTAAQVQNVSPMSVLFQKRIYAIALGIVNEVPFGTGKFSVPKALLPAGRTVTENETSYEG